MATAAITTTASMQGTIVFHHFGGPLSSTTLVLLESLTASLFADRGGVGFEFFPQTQSHRLLRQQSLPGLSSGMELASRKDDPVTDSLSTAPAETTRCAPGVK
jgi:hypothetical protein